MFENFFGGNKINKETIEKRLPELSSETPDSVSIEDLRQKLALEKKELANLCEMARNDRSPFDAQEIEKREQRIKGLKNQLAELGGEALELEETQ